MSFDSYQFDFGGLSGTRTSSSRPLRDQKSNTTPNTSTPAWTHQPASKTSWTHQPSPALSNSSSGPTSMVGDIFGKTWSTNTTTTTTTSSSNIGIPQSKNPNLFSDLLGPALNRAGPTNAPLKSAPPASRPAPASKPASAPAPAFSMNNLQNSLPKTTGQPMKSSAPPPMGSQIKDPFSSLADFGSKPAPSTTDWNHGFGSFQTVKNPSTARPSPAPTNSAANFDQGFGSFQTTKSPAPAPPPPAPAPTNSGADPLDMLFSSKSTPPVAAQTANAGDMFGEMNDWDVGAEYGGGDGGGPTTELDGLAPPPVGLSVSAAKSKGKDNYKNGQYADAIKWLSWAVVLIEKAGDDAAIVEVLSCRASSYKEVGEYKKAIADCTKVLEQDKENVSVLLQRALLYESTEKYRLGAEDLRMVLKIDPGNRLARSTIHRLNKLSD